MATLIEQLAQWAEQLTLDQVPERVQQAVRAQTLSVIGSRFAGGADRAARAVTATATSWPEGPCSAAPFERRLHPHYAVLVNAALSMVYDYDDYLLIGHTGHSSVSVSRALAVALGRSNDEALLACVAANEVAGRLGFSSFFGPQNGQQLPFIHQAGAAIAAGRLLKLSAEQLSCALALALSQPPAPLWPSFFGASGAKILVAAQPAVVGIQCAEMAKNGMTCSLDLLDHSHGFYRRFTFMPVPALLRGLGETWLSDSIHLKAYPACAYNQTVFDALEKAIREADARGEPVQPNNIQRISVEATLLAQIVSNLGESRRSGELLPNDVNYSIPLGVAVYLLAGKLTPDQLQPEWLAENRKMIELLADRVVVKHNVDYTRALLAAIEDRLQLSRMLGAVTNRALVEAVPQWIQSFAGYPELTMEMLEQLLPTVSGVVELVQGWINRDQSADYDLATYDLEGFQFPFGVRVSLMNTNGDEFAESALYPDGAVADIAGCHQQAREKFLRYASGLDDPEGAADRVLDGDGALELF